jgi:SAM-dependent methyltransferase
LTAAHRQPRVDGGRPTRLGRTLPEIGALPSYPRSGIWSSTVTESDFLRTIRAFYDAVAIDYAERFRAELATKPLDRALLAGFAELVRTAGAGPVADLGCGPGRVTAHLHALGLPVFGVDLSPQMVALARRSFPDLRFDEGSMTALDLPDGALGGIVAWYSTIHIPRERLPEVFAEFHRMLAPGGHVLLAFQVGAERLRVTEPFGHPVSLDFHRRSPERIAELLSRAGFGMRARLVREPDEGVEKTQQAFLLARKPAEVSRS